MFSTSSDTETVLHFSRYLGTQGQIPSILLLVATKGRVATLGSYKGGATKREDCCKKTDYSMA